MILKMQKKIELDTAPFVNFSEIYCSQVASRIWTQPNSKVYVYKNLTKNPKHLILHDNGIKCSSLDLVQVSFLKHSVHFYQ